MSIDHKPDDIMEKNRVQKAGGDVYNGRINGNLNLSRAMGDLEYKMNQNIPRDQQLIISTPDIKTFKINKESEFIVVGCDGIWEVKSNQEICDFVRTRIRKNEPLEKIVEDLLDSLLAKDTSG